MAQRKNGNYPSTTADPLRKLPDLVKHSPNIRNHILPITFNNCIPRSTQCYVKDRPILCAVYLKMPPNKHYNPTVRIITNHANI